MTTKNNYKDFDALTVALQDSNLIEASAGTGKTYSIAILALRLVLEQKISIKEILMVTFTKAAVAELEDRIRIFIRKAYKASQGKEINDDNIEKLVVQSIRNSNEKEVQQLLRDAVLLLDETSVLTIHSFCQQTLTEFAFETSQLFGAEMMPDIQPVIENEVNKFWRKEVTTLPVNLLKKIVSKDIMGSIKKIVKEHLSGKKYLGFDETKDYAITKDARKLWLKELDILEEKENLLRTALHQHVVDNTDLIITKSSGNAYARNNTLPLLQSPQEFLNFIWSKRDKVNIIKVHSDIVERLTECELVTEENNLFIQTIVQRLYCLAIKEVGDGVQAFKEKNNKLGYDDLISNLYTALISRNNPYLCTALQRKYKAVFVDEFQDTDRQQFEIFDRAFNGFSILFYIGDPKQSIYAWRKADIYTYFKARSGADHLYKMNRNFRSSATYIEAMNRFFLPVENFDTFHFDTEENRIDYINVESPVNNKKGELHKGELTEIPISIFELSKKEEISQAVAAQTACLLKDGEYVITKDSVARCIRPSDIGILVRKGVEGKEIKAQLASLGIPAVTVDDSKILQSEEARFLLYLLSAMESANRSSINRALLSPFTAFTTQDILKLDDETTLRLFSKYHDRWQKDGIYTALMDFISDFNVRNTLLHSYTENGERIITNLFQLTELVHMVQSRKNLSMIELISWLQRGLNGMATEGDEYTQRVESDEEAVKIVTIHGSKGLEYNIVLAPYLDFVDNPFEFASFRDPISGDYVNMERNLMSPDQLSCFLKQAEQENRRLLYVTITRAVYKCYIFKNTFNKFSNSTLSTFLTVLEPINSNAGYINFEQELPPNPENIFNVEQEAADPEMENRPVNFELKEEYWRKMSYTLLAEKQVQSPRPGFIPSEDDYENFIFRILPRGDKTGNMLHSLFENISFTEDIRWNKWLEETVKSFVPGQEELYLPMLRQLLLHVFNTTIHIGAANFSLASVAFNKRISELEFDFPVQLFQPEIINGFSTEDQIVNVKRFGEHTAYELEGMMNGKIDLFFEQDGLYYVLDWKSNYLGGTIKNYSPSTLKEAMNEGNYHLQYLIYTLAVKKYLQTRIVGFDYETQFGGVIYLFVRGMRNNSPDGIYTTKPSLAKILQLESLLNNTIEKSIS